MSLNHKDQERIQAFYEKALRTYGSNDARSLQWTDEYNQIRRFAALTYVGDLDGARILDVGSGLGDLYHFLKNQDFRIDYTGIDIVPEMVEEARSKYPGVVFEVRDVFDMNETFGYVLASGALSFRVENNDAHYQAMIRKMYDLAEVAVAFNMLDKRTHPNTEIYAAYDPQEVADFCSSFAQRVEIATDYLPRDFTIYLYKE